MLVHAIVRQARKSRSRVSSSSFTKGRTGPKGSRPSQSCVLIESCPEDSGDLRACWLHVTGRRSSRWIRLFLLGRVEVGLECVEIRSAVARGVFDTLFRPPVWIEPVDAVELRHALRDLRIQLALVFRVTREGAAPFCVIPVGERQALFLKRSRALRSA